MTTEKDVNRPYRSTLRAAQAQSTRLLIIEAAQKLFVVRGYGATSIDAIAVEAGVARATVFTAVGGKAVLLKTAYDVALVGDDDPVPLPERPWARPVREEPDRYRMLDLYARMLGEVHSRVAGINEAIRGAAGLDPEASLLWNEVQEQRRVGARNIVAMLVAKGGIKDGLDPLKAADILAVLIEPGIYVQLVLQSRWSRTHFEVWLAETMKSQLLS
jgi:AcrR family transcriptional regulator